MPLFQASTAPAEWREMSNFALACERAELSIHQASAARLAALGFSVSETGRLLDLADYAAARQILRNAAIKLERSETDVRETQIQQRRLMLRTMKAGHLPPDRETWGVTPAQHHRLTAARCFGEVAQDCIPDARRQPLAFLRALYNLLPV
jgi:hypothetical protein